MMLLKYLSVITLILGLSFSASAQKGQWSFSIGYLGEYLVNPGVKVGAQFNYHAWEKEKESKKGAYTLYQNLYISPQLGYYTRVGNHSNYYANLDIGYQHQMRKIYTTYAIGLGYMLKDETLSKTVDLGSGQKSRVNEINHFFVPTFMYGLGGQLSGKLGWFVKGTVGAKIPKRAELDLLVLVELGVMMSLGE